MDMLRPRRSLHLLDTLLWHSSRKIRSILRRSCPYHTCCLYLGTKTMGYLPYQRTEDGLGQSRMRASLQGNVVVGCQEALSSVWMHDGTAEPLRISPPEAVAYPI